MSSVANRRPAPLRIALTAFLVFWLILAAFPFLWTLWGSFKVEGDFFSRADWRFSLFGTQTEMDTGSSFTDQGYYGAWVQEEFWRAALNTLIVVVLTLGGGIAAFAAWSGALAGVGVAGGVLHLLGVFAMLAVVELPFSVYRTFGLEQRFGFRMTACHRPAVRQPEAAR
jgi:ABC-type glycerol-3-phosphate transport system permease component